MDVQIANPDPKHSQVDLIKPTTVGYIHLTVGEEMLW